MADRLATLTDLRAMPGLADVTDATGNKLLEIATSIVQGEVGQNLVLTQDDVAEILGTTDSWLDLPQRPVVSIASIELDGEEIDDHKKFGDRLWRRCGWAACPSEPCLVAVVYNHGYVVGDRDLELAKSAVIMLAGGATEELGVESEKIDDYEVVYRVMTQMLEDAQHLVRSLHRKYGRRVGLVRLG